jgi:hypothetical protein
MEQQIISDNLASELSDYDYVGFWKHVSKINNTKKSLVASTVGRAIGIREMWSNDFAAILN